MSLLQSSPSTSLSNSVNLDIVLLDTASQATWYEGIRYAVGNACIDKLCDHPAGTHTCIGVPFLWIRVLREGLGTVTRFVL